MWRDLKRMSEEGKELTYIRWLRNNTSRRATSPELREHAWEAARKAARILKERYGVDRVRVFGSLVHEEMLHSGSDIDLAVEGLKPMDYWEALASVMFLDDRLPIEVVDRAACRPEIWSVVEREGIDL